MALSFAECEAAHDDDRHERGAPESARDRLATYNGCPGVAHDVRDHLVGGHVFYERQRLKQVYARLVEKAQVRDDTRHAHLEQQRSEAGNLQDRVID